LTVGIVLFAVLALVALLSAIGMVTSTNAVHAALFLVINLFCVALFYLGLSAPFLAMVQITVYAGAIMVLFLFVIMLLGAERMQAQSRLRWQTPLAIILAIALLASGAFAVLSPQIGLTLTSSAPLASPASGQPGFGDPKSIGMSLFTTYLLPFEMTGILLLVAMIGAVTLAKDDKPKRKPQFQSEDRK